MNFFQFLKEVITSHSGISSKRVCSLLGWVVCLSVLIYCTIRCIQAPTMIDITVIAVLGLLGIDSVTGIWKNKQQ